MGVAMGKPEWGAKRLCTSCGVKFYDFNKTPVTCPKCGSRVEPDPPARSKRPPPAKPAKPPAPPEPKQPVAAATEGEPEKTDADEAVADLADGGIEIEVDDDDDEFAALADDDEDDDDVSAEIATPRPDDET